MGKIAQQWADVMREAGYDHHVQSGQTCRDLAHFERVWRRLASRIPLLRSDGAGKSAFEFGVGGAKNLIPLALRGWKSMGIDGSSDVLERAKDYIKEVEARCEKKLSIDLVFGDFLDYQTNQQFDITFHAGTLEHFLDDDERHRALEKMFAITKPGGYVVSIVPSGVHPLRKKEKQYKLGGYAIPEVDYNIAKIREEFERCGGRDIVILPHNLFGYWFMDNRTDFLHRLKLRLFYLLQLVPIGALPTAIAERYCGSFIGIARK